MSDQWPTAEVDRIGRLRVLAALSPGAVVVESVLPHRFDQVWRVAADLERELPQCLPDVRRFTITREDGERLEADARGYLGLRAHFDVVLRPGWCVMRSRFLLGAIAAEPVDDATRFAFLGGLRFPGLRPAAPLVHRLGAPAITRVVNRYGKRVDRRDWAQ